MSDLLEAARGLGGFLPFLLALVLAGLALWAVDWVLMRVFSKGSRDRQFVRHLTMLALTALLLVVALAALPIEDGVRQQLLQVVGLIVTAALAFSSTTFVSNVFAGLMLRAVRNFEPGDFIRVGDHFGRVTERGLFHTEIQTEDSDLMTLPNLYLASNPVKVVRSTGTIVSVGVSLGYDVSHRSVEPILSAAAESVGLERPSVRVLDLLDHAVVYRVAGWLGDVTDLPFAGGKLRIALLDGLHAAGIEIASPSLRTLRGLAPHDKLVPGAEPAGPQPAEAEPSADQTAFDKAEQAGQVAKLKAEVEKLDGEIEKLEQAIKKREADGEEANLDRLKAQRDQAAERLDLVEDAD